MQSLYKNGLEFIYDEMYQTFIDYEDEFNFYSNIIDRHHKKSVLEIGCGTGNLAKHFINSHIDYIGLDLSTEMINLSQKKNPGGKFVTGNIINFELNMKVEAAIITGRTTSYLLDNSSVYAALKSIYNSLNKNGIICFDFIDANRFLVAIKNGKKIRHDASFNDKHYYRESFMYRNQLENFMFNWDAEYYERKLNESVKLATDKSVVRAFTKNEWELFLSLSDFKVLEFIDRKSYAFDTFVVVAQKQ